ncbi:MAG: hypothetical protein NTV30_03630 [Chloroflexi bacterium]|nr:hypothetical protein [Chloroflexota bacterium]
MFKLFKRQNGMALPLVLILLSLGGLSITPAVHITTSNTSALKRQEENLNSTYAAEAAAQYTLWQLQNGGADDIDHPGDSSTETITVNGIDVEVDTSVPSTSEAAAAPSQQSGDYLHVSIACNTGWIKWTGTNVGYQIFLTNYGTYSMYASSCKIKLPAGFTYVNGSTFSFPLWCKDGYPAVTVEDGQQVIEWKFKTGILYDIGRKISVNSSKSIFFQVNISNNLAGVYQSEGWGYSNARTSGGTIISDHHTNIAAVWNRVYPIVPRARGTTCRIVVCLNEDNHLEIVTYELNDN